MWSRFDIETGGGRLPFLYESVLPLHLGFSGYGAVQKAAFALRDSAFRSGVDCRVRVYIGEDRRDDLAEGVFDGSAIVGEGLPEYMKRLTGQDRFSLVINNLEQANGQLAADFGQFIRSFFIARGLPLGGVEQAAFCGNYTGTAFGIHEGFEHAFLCHLGPGVKNFYCWSRADYMRVTGTRKPTFSNSASFERLLECGELFVLKPGDVLYLPASVYHIGRQQDYSVSVALPLYTYPFSRFASRGVLPALADCTLPFDHEGMSPHLSFIDRNPLVDPISELLRTTFESWIGNELPRFLAFYWHRLRSNGGWELPRSIATNLFEESDLSAPLDIERGTLVRLRRPYVLSYQRGLDCEPDRMRAFVAGRSVAVSSCETDLADMATRLNDGETLKVNSGGLSALFRELSRTGGLEIVSVD